MQHPMSQVVTFSPKFRLLLPYPRTFCFSLKHALFKTSIMKSIASVNVYLFMLTHSHWENTVCKDRPLISVTPQYH